MTSLARFAIARFSSNDNRSLNAAEFWSWVTKLAKDELNCPNRMKEKKPNKFSDHLWSRNLNSNRRVVRPSHASSPPHSPRHAPFEFSQLTQNMWNVSAAEHWKFSPLVPCKETSLNFHNVYRSLISAELHLTCKQICSRLLFFIVLVKLRTRVLILIISPLSLFLQWFTPERI